MKANLLILLSLAATLLSTKSLAQNNDSAATQQFLFASSQLHAAGDNLVAVSDLMRKQTKLQIGFTITSLIATGLATKILFSSPIAPEVIFFTGITGVAIIIIVVDLIKTNRLIKLKLSEAGEMLQGAAKDLIKKK